MDFLRRMSLVWHKTDQSALSTNVRSWAERPEVSGCIVKTGAVDRQQTFRRLVVDDPGP
jgi:hypothetical protein